MCDGDVGDMDRIRQVSAEEMGGVVQLERFGSLMCVMGNGWVIWTE